MDYVDAQTAVGNTANTVPEMEVATSDTANVDERMN